MTKTTPKTANKRRTRCIRHAKKCVNRTIDSINSPFLLTLLTSVSIMAGIAGMTSQRRPTTTDGPLIFNTQSYSFHTQLDTNDYRYTPEQITSQICYFNDDASTEIAQALQDSTQNIRTQTCFTTYCRSLKPQHQQTLADQATQFCRQHLDGRGNLKQDCSSDICTRYYCTHYNTQNRQQGCQPISDPATHPISTTPHMPNYLLLPASQQDTLPRGGKSIKSDYLFDAERKNTTCQIGNTNTTTPASCTTLSCDIDDNNCTEHPTRRITQTTNCDDNTCNIILTEQIGTNQTADSWITMAQTSTTSNTQAQQRIQTHYNHNPYQSHTTNNTHDSAPTNTTDNTTNSTSGIGQTTLSIIAAPETTDNTDTQ